MSDDKEFPSLGFDPAPGKVESVEDLSNKINRASSGLESAHKTLMGIAKGGKTWEGLAANAFTQHVGDLPKSLSDSVDALKQASAQLGNWRGKLSGYQNTARQYEAQAKAAKERIKTQEAAHDRATNAYNQAASAPAFRLAGQYYTDQTALNEAQSKLDAAQARLKTAGQELDSVGKRLDAAKDELDDIIKQAKELLEHHQSDARDIADRLRKANKNAPDISLFERLGDFFKRMGHGIKEWCVKHADLLKTIGDWLGNIAGVLGVLSLLTMWCPPLSGALALAGGALSLGSLAAHAGAKLGGAKVSWTDLGMDAVGVIPFGKFAKVGALGKVKIRVGSRELIDTATGARSLVNDVDKVAQVNHLEGLVQRGIASSDDLARGRSIGPIERAGGRVFEANGGFSNRMKLAWESHVSNNMASGIKEQGWAQTLKKIPGVADADSFKAALRADGTLDPMSWWSRGPLVGQGAVSAGVGSYQTATEG
ncbi:putative T7SS-secreted protein [Streptomyces chrestomyceticus]|uniref:putative T7SS-secreted protein n=1 Tax=Streptomyces chrestomyceticus TaxID=68185 RepID=UPI003698EE95